MEEDDAGRTRKNIPTPQPIFKQINLGPTIAQQGGNQYNAQQMQFLTVAEQAPLEKAADLLAGSVHDRWTDEEEKRHLHDPISIQVRWVNADDGILDQWANIRLLKSGPAPSIDLSGRLDQILDTFVKVPSRRLIILGKPGSGKTILASRLALTLLEGREAGQPVPVILNCASWNPREIGWRDWLIRQLHLMHPGLLQLAPGNGSLGNALVRAGRILPILDGFDEIGSGLHRYALKQLSATKSALVLTSRVEEFRNAVAGADVLTSAAGLVIQDLKTADLEPYLPRTTRIRSESNAETKWDPVLRRLGERDGQADVIRDALSTPLMVALARTIYSDSPTNDPVELLDTKRFPTARTLEDYLLSCFIPAVYDLPPMWWAPSEDRAAKVKHWDKEDALGWHRYIAEHMERTDSDNLRWWRLRDSVPLAARVAAFGAAAALTCGILGDVSLIVLEGHSPHWLSSFPMPGPWILGFVVGAAVGLAPEGPQPIRSQLRINKRLRVLFGNTVVGLVGGVLGTTAGNIAMMRLPSKYLPLTFAFLAAVAVAVGLAGNKRNASDETLTRGRMSRRRTGALAAAAGLGGSLLAAWEGGLLVGLIGGAVLGVVGWMETPIDLRDSLGPLDLLRADRKNTVIKALIYGLVVGTAGGAAIALVSLPYVGLIIGAAAASLVMLAVVIATTAWGQWVLLIRGWLAATQNLPAALPAFLDDAHLRGVLRQTGAVYQFRHARLRACLKANVAPALSVKEPARPD